MERFFLSIAFAGLWGRGRVVHRLRANAPRKAVANRQRRVAGGRRVPTGQSGHSHNGRAGARPRPLVCPMEQLV